MVKGKRGGFYDDDDLDDGYGDDDYYDEYDDEEPLPVKPAPKVGQQQHAAKVHAASGSRRANFAAPTAVAVQSRRSATAVRMPHLNDGASVFFLTHMSAL